MQIERQTLKKAERLKSKKLIDELFSKGKVIHHYPFKVMYLFTDSQDFEYPAKIGVGASKRNFKKAVERNYLKRKMREAYRKNKSELYKALISTNQKLYFFVIYTAKQDIAYSEIEYAMQMLLKKFTAKG